MRTKYDVVIAIDPDTERSGVAYLDVTARHIEAMSLTFPQLLDYIRVSVRRAQAEGGHPVVVVEAGCANHETGRKIVEMCRHWGIAVEEQRPLQKMWRGRGGKITAPELQEITGLASRTSQDARDAALLAWVWAGLPVRISNDRQQRN